MTSGIPQGSVLGPILFIFINDLPEFIKPYLKIFADDTKPFKALHNILKDWNVIQEDIQKLAAWSIKWQLPFKVPKCKIVHYGKNAATCQS